MSIPISPYPHDHVVLEHTLAGASTGNSSALHPPPSATLPPNSQSEAPSEVGRTSATMKRKAPRKLDSEKCRRCRRDKVKCTPQPSVWPKKCDRCESKDFECSAPESKRRTNKKTRANSGPSTISGPDTNLGPDANLGPSTFSGPDASLGPNSNSRQGLAGPSPPVDGFDGNMHLTGVVTGVKLLNGLSMIADEFVWSLRCITGSRGVYVKSFSDMEILAASLREGLRSSIETPCSAQRIMNTSMLQDLTDSFFTATYDTDGGNTLGLKRADENVSLALQLGATEPESENLFTMAFITDRLAKRLPEWLPASHLELTTNLSKMLRWAVIGAMMSDPCTPQLGGDKDDKRIILQIWLSNILATRLEIGRIPAQSLQAIRTGYWDLSHLTFFTRIYGFNKVNDDGLSLLHVAIASERTEVALQLVRSGASVDLGNKVLGYDLLHWAAGAGNTAVYEHLQDQRQPVPLNEEPRGGYGELPLHMAIVNGHTSMVDTILSKHTHATEYLDIVDDYSGRTPLGLAVVNNRRDIVQRLVARRNPNFMTQPSTNCNILHDLARDAAFHDLFRQIVTKVPEDMINTQDDIGYTPLHCLAESADRETMDAILSITSVKPDLTDNDGKTPILLAVEHANLAAFEFLCIRRDVDISILYRIGRVPALGNQFVWNYMAHPPEWKGQEKRASLKEMLDWLRQRFNDIEGAA